MFGTISEECGVFGIYTKELHDVAAETYYGLFALQHRGQESCGIVVNNDGFFRAHKAAGLVNDVFDRQTLSSLGMGRIAVGHVRYATTGSNAGLNAQPFVVNHAKYSMALAHNGNLTNADMLRRELEMQGAIFSTTSDTEVICYIITKERINSASIEEAVKKTMKLIDGAYSLVLMSHGKLIAVRDPHGFRPLCMGTLKDGGYVFASESCALDSIGARFERDVEPGEIVVVDDNGVRSIKCGGDRVKTSMCVFEFIYFARPDSVLDGSSVSVARQRAGGFLALSHPVQADVVIGVPDSGIDAAVGYSRQSGIPYSVGFVKNKYIGRTLITPGQSSREDKVRIKLSPIKAAVEGKRVVLIDDSIVRGTTSARIVRMVRECGAKEVHMRVSAPPFKHPCYFGTDIDSEENLIASNHTVEEIARMIGADSLGYLSCENARLLADRTGLGFCTACFDGEYPVRVSGSQKKNGFEPK